MNELICIAGKNSIAVSCASYIRIAFPKHKLVACTNRTDNGTDGWQPSYKKWCAHNGVRILPLEELYDLSELTFFSLEYDRILRTARFSTNALFNIHFSLLPSYKGMYTSALPILHGRATSGVTLHQIDAGIDTGNIISQIEFEICDTWTARDLYLTYLGYGERLFLQNIQNVINGQFVSHPQPSKDSSYYSRTSIDYSNLNIDLNKTAFEISCQIRAFSFKEYQVPRLFGRNVTNCQILDRRSTKKPGSLIHSDDSLLEISSIDYDLKVSCEPVGAPWRPG